MYLIAIKLLTTARMSITLLQHMGRASPDTYITVMQVPIDCDTVCPTEWALFIRCLRKEEWHPTYFQEIAYSMASSTLVLIGGAGQGTGFHVDPAHATNIAYAWTKEDKEVRAGRGDARRGGAGRSGATRCKAGRGGADRGNEMLCSLLRQKRLGCLWLWWSSGRRVRQGVWLGVAEEGGGGGHSSGRGSCSYAQPHPLPYPPTHTTT